MMEVRTRRHVCPARSGAPVPPVPRPPLAQLNGLRRAAGGRRLRLCAAVLMRRRFAGLQGSRHPVLRHALGLREYLPEHTECSTVTAHALGTPTPRSDRAHRQLLRARSRLVCAFVWDSAVIHQVNRRRGRPPSALRCTYAPHLFHTFIASSQYCYSYYSHPYFLHHIRFLHPASHRLQLYCKPARTALHPPHPTFSASHAHAHALTHGSGRIEISLYQHPLPACLPVCRDATHARPPAGHLSEHTCPASLRARLVALFMSAPGRRHPTPRGVAASPRAHVVQRCPQLPVRHSCMRWLVCSASRPSHRARHCPPERGGLAVKCRSAISWGLPSTSRAPSPRRDALACRVVEEKRGAKRRGERRRVRHGC